MASRVCGRQLYPSREAEYIAGIALTAMCAPVAVSATRPVALRITRPRRRDRSLYCGRDAVACVVRAVISPLDACTPGVSASISVAGFSRRGIALCNIALALFGGSLTRGHEKANDALTRVLAGYWQASGLLLFAVLLNAAHSPAAAFAGLLVQAVVAASLNWWTDLLEDIENEDGTLERIFRAWRPLATAAAVLGVGVQVPFQNCNFVSDLRSDCLCVAWTEPPVRLFEIVAGGVDENLLAALGGFGYAVYLAYAAYFVTVVLPRVGRSGRKERDVFSAVSVLIWLGWIGKGAEEETKQEML